MVLIVLCFVALTPALGDEPVADKPGADQSVTETFGGGVTPHKAPGKPETVDAPGKPGTVDPPAGPAPTIGGGVAEPGKTPIPADAPQAGKADGAIEGEAGGAVEGEARVVELPPDLPIRRHYYNPATGEQRLLTAGPSGGLSDENLVYSNTPPPALYLALGIPNVQIADDLMLVSVGGCDVTAYEVLVSGGGDGTGPGFTATMKMFDGCPHGGGQVIPGTEAVVTLDDDGLHTIVVDLSAAPVSVGKTVWLSVALDTFPSGWIFGSVADIGFTTNVYDFMYTHCSAWFGGTSFYAGFHARVWCQPPFEREFPAYLNADLTGLPFLMTAGGWLMDDIELIVDDCVLSSYEIGVRADREGDYTLTAELRSQCGSPYTIEGTQGTAHFDGDGVPKFVRVEFPGGVDLGGSHPAWMAYKFDRSASAIFSGEATLGFTDDLFGLPDGDSCDIYWFAGDPWAGLAINIFCAGSTPTGACCDLTSYIHDTCRETSEFACDPEGNERRWSEGTTCNDPFAFDPPCGTAACCTPPEGPYGEGCFNLTQEECEGIVDGAGNPAVWRDNYACDTPAEGCPRWVCRVADGLCDVPHDTPGCASPYSYCCNWVCDVDPFCCEVEWDWNCVRRIMNQCLGWSPPSYDECWSDELGHGAFEVGSNSVSYLQNPGAESTDDEAVCCRSVGAGAPVYGGIWAKFTATHTTARIDTCDTVDDRADDSLLQLMRAADHSSEQAACETLTTIACNDDGDCGNHQAAICADGLVPGETYYILLASATDSDVGEYFLTVTSPAPSSCDEVANRPVNDTCEEAISFEPSASFDLTDATVECPTERCVNFMSRDVWYEYVAPQSGIVVFDTCAELENDTILIAYDGAACPVTSNRRLTCGDQGCGKGMRIWFDAVQGEAYLIRVGGRGDYPMTGTLNVAPWVDCQPNNRLDAVDIHFGFSEDCNRNDVPDECDIASGDSTDNDGNGILDECEVCPAGPMEFIGLTIAGDGVWRDARQPHPIDAPLPLSGRSTFDFIGPPGSDNIPCWSLCETEANSDLHSNLIANEIEQIIDHGNGTFTIELRRPITHGEVTTLVYHSGDTEIIRGDFEYLPGDVGFDGVTDPSDIIYLVDKLNGVRGMPWGLAGCDIDRNGVCDVADIDALLDLLNGIDAFGAWFGIELPEPVADCP